MWSRPDTRRWEETKTMSEYTHIIHEAGNGLPGVGDEVLDVDHEGVTREIMVVEASSSIQTRQYAANYIEVALRASDRDYDDLNEAEQDEAFEALPHARPID
jgi:hypothetical protein